MPVENSWIFFHIVLFHYLGVNRRLGVAVLFGTRPRKIMHFILQPARLLNVKTEEYYLMCLSSWPTKGWNNFFLSDFPFHVHQLFRTAPGVQILYLGIFAISLLLYFAIFECSLFFTIYSTVMSGKKFLIYVAFAPLNSDPLEFLRYL